MQTLRENKDLQHRVSTWVEDMRRKSREDRERRIAIIGLDHNVSCAICGDEGREYVIDPEGRVSRGDLCSCDIGEELRYEAKRRTAWAAIVPTLYRDATLDGDHWNQDTARLVREWLAKDPVRNGINLVINGGTGRLKTWSAVAGIRELQAKGFKVRFASWPDVVDAMRCHLLNREQAPEWRDGALWHYRDADCVVMDDLGVENETEFTTAAFTRILSHRVNNRLPTVITTNLDREEFEARIDARGLSRLREDGHYMSFVAQGPDYRIKGPGVG